MKRDWKSINLLLLQDSGGGKQWFNAIAIVIFCIFPPDAFPLFSRPSPKKKAEISIFDSFFIGIILRADAKAATYSRSFKFNNIFLRPSVFFFLSFPRFATWHNRFRIPASFRLLPDCFRKDHSWCWAVKKGGRKWKIKLTKRRKLCLSSTN